MGEHKELGSFIDRTYKVVRQDLINRLKGIHADITPEQWMILSKLDGGKVLYQTEIARMSFKDKPTVSRILGLLVEKGMVIRKPDENDGRKFKICLTDAGQKEVNRARPAVIDSREVGWTNLTEQEYEMLVSLLDKVFINYTKEKS